jgi:hydroxymethylpyrimidine/phosphomethylpyrimidine kinase
MLGSAAVANTVADFLEEARLSKTVLDPVLRSSSGASLLEAAGIDALRNRLLPLADLITPNIDEAAALAGVDPLPPESSWRSAKPAITQLADHLHAMGGRGVLITGGHLAEPVDFLSLQQPDGTRLVHEFPGQHLDSRSTHGTGCAMATALACLLARGVEISAAVVGAKDYVREAIRLAEPLGRGVGPLKHLYRQ